jgi:hypothetical protein
MYHYSLLTRLILMHPFYLLSYLRMWHDASGPQRNEYQAVEYNNYMSLRVSKNTVYHLEKGESSIARGPQGKKITLVGSNRCQARRWTTYSSRFTFSARDVRSFFCRDEERCILPNGIGSLLRLRALTGPVVEGGTPLGDSGEGEDSQADGGAGELAAAVEVIAGPSETFRADDRSDRVRSLREEDSRGEHRSSEKG